MVALAVGMTQAAKHDRAKTAVNREEIITALIALHRLMSPLPDERIREEHPAFSSARPFYAI